MQVEVDLSRLSEASLHSLLDDNQGTQLGTEILLEFLRRDSTIKLDPGFSADSLREVLELERHHD